MRDGCVTLSPLMTGDYWPVHVTITYVLGPRMSYCSQFHASLQQTSRIWDAQSGETKAELRGHDNSVESITFVPVTSHKALSELVDIGVRCMRFGALFVC